MYQASNEFVSNLDTAPLVVRLTFADGRVIPADPENTSTYPIQSVNFKGCSSNGSTATIGCAVSAGAEIVLDRNLLESAEFGAQKLNIDVGMKLSGNYEWIPMGAYRITKPERTDDTVTLQCADDIGTILERPYTPLEDFDFEAGVSGKAFLSALCARHGVPVNMEGLPDVVLEIASPEDLTERQIVAALAGLWGKFACMDRTGTLRFLWYSASGVQIGPANYYDGECVCGDPFTASYLKCYNSTLAETLEAGDSSGQQGMYFECPWCDQEHLEALWADLQGFAYDSVESVRLLGNPLLDPWDMITLTDAAGISFNVPAMAIAHEYDGGMITEISAPGEGNAAIQEGPVKREFKRVAAQIIKRQNAILLEVKQTYATKDSVTESLNTIEQKITEQENSILLQVSQTVDRIQVGGRNLLLNSNAEFSNNDYRIAHYTPSEFLVAGETYTVTMCVTPASNVSCFALFLSNGWSTNAVLPVSGTAKQIVTKTFTAQYYPDRTPDVGAAYGRIDFYRLPDDGTVTGSSTVHWVKVEKGNKATDWTPAPEDVTAELKLCIKEDENGKIVSMLNASADQISIKGNRLTIDSTNFKLTAAGEMTCTKGNIAGWSIDENSIRSGVLGEADSMWLCRNGTSTSASIGGSESVSGWCIGIGADFGVTKAGKAYLRDAYVSGEVVSDKVTITGGSLKIPISDITGAYAVMDSTGVGCSSVDYDAGTGSAIKLEPGRIKYESGKLGQSVFLIDVSDSTGAVKKALYGTWYIGSLGSSTQVTSDRNAKHDIAEQPAVYSRIFDRLRPVIFKYNNGTSNRLHTGLIAQDVEDAVLAEGLSTKEFAAVCYDLDESGAKVNYGIRYEEMVSMLIYEVQQAKLEIKTLKSMLSQEATA